MRRGLGGAGPRRRGSVCNLDHVQQPVSPIGRLALLRDPARLASAAPRSRSFMITRAASSVFTSGPWGGWLPVGLVCAKRLIFRHVPHPSRFALAPTVKCLAQATSPARRSKLLTSRTTTYIQPAPEVKPMTEPKLASALGLPSYSPSASVPQHSTTIYRRDRAGCGRRQRGHRAIDQARAQRHAGRTIQMTHHSRNRHEKLSNDDRIAMESQSL